MQQCNLFISIPFILGNADWDTAPTYANTAPAVKRSYLDAVLAEMRGFADEAPSLEVASVTFGTGSVSTIPEADLHDFLGGIARLFRIASETPVHAVFDPGLFSVGQANELKAFGSPRLEFRYLTSNCDEASVLGAPSGEVEMRKTSILLEQAGFGSVVVQIAVGTLGQTVASLEKTLRDALSSTVGGFELVPLREDWAGAQSDDEAAVLFGHACAWLEEHGFRSTSPTRFMREGIDDPYHRSRYALPGARDGIATLSFGPSTLSVFDGLLWSNIGDVNRYIRESADFQAITEQVVELDAAAVAQRKTLDALYHGQSVELDGERYRSLIERAMLSVSREQGSVRLSAKGRLRYAEAFARLAESCDARYGTR